MGRPHIDPFQVIKTAKPATIQDRTGNTRHAPWNLPRRRLSPAPPVPRVSTDHAGRWSSAPGIPGEIIQNYPSSSTLEPTSALPLSGPHFRTTTEPRSDVHLAEPSATILFKKKKDSPHAGPSPTGTACTALTFSNLAVISSSLKQHKMSCLYDHSYGVGLGMAPDNDLVRTCCLA